MKRLLHNHLAECACGGLLLILVGSWAWTAYVLSVKNQELNEANRKIETREDTIGKIQGQLNTTTAQYRRAVAAQSAAETDLTRRKDQEKDLAEWFQLHDQQESLYEAVNQSVSQLSGEGSVHRQGAYVVLDLPANTFDLGSASPNKNFVDSLTVVRDIYAKYQGDYILGVEGHTDNSGGATAHASDKNYELGAKRALTVLAKLRAMGVPSNKLAVVSWGSNLPKFAEDTSDAERERRVELVFAPKRIAEESENTIPVDKPLASNESAPTMRGTNVITLRDDKETMLENPGEVAAKANVQPQPHVRQILLPPAPTPPPVETGLPVPKSK